MKLEELFALHEQAKPRKDVEGQITHLAEPIVTHLIKILKWDDQLNFKKHCRDIDNWFLQISVLRVKGKKIPKRRDFFQWMFTDVVQDQYMVDLRINRGLYDYHHLPEIRTNEEVFEELKRMFTEISFDLEKRQLKEIENYF